MITIQDCTGLHVWRTDSLKDVRSFMCKYTTSKLYKVELFELKEQQGLFIASYDNGTTIKVMFRDFEELKFTLTNWRSLYGVPLYVDGELCEMIYKTNPHLKRIKVRKLEEVA